MRWLLLILPLLLPANTLAAKTITMHGKRWKVRTTRVDVEADVAKPAATLEGEVLVYVEDKRSTGAWPQWVIGAITTSTQYSVSHDVYGAERGVDGAIGALVAGVARSRGFGAVETLATGPEGAWAGDSGHMERDTAQARIEVAVVDWWAGATGNPFAPVECTLSLDLAFFQPGATRASVSRSVELTKILTPFRFGKSIWEQGTEASVPLLEAVLSDALVRRTLLTPPPRAGRAGAAIDPQSRRADRRPPGASGRRGRHRHAAEAPDGGVPRALRPRARHRLEASAAPAEVGAVPPGGSPEPTRGPVGAALDRGRSAVGAGRAPAPPLSCAWATG